MNTSVLRSRAERFLQEKGHVQLAPDLAIKLGAVERSLGERLLRRRPHVTLLEGVTGETKVVIFSSRRDASQSRWIVIAPEGHLERLILPKIGEPQILEDWGMDDRVDQPRPDNMHPADQEALERFSPALG